MSARLTVLIAISSIGVAVMLSLTGFQWFGLSLLGIGGTGLIMLAIGYYYGYYHIEYDYFKGSIVTFQFPLWKRILLLGYMPPLTQVEAKVSYRYGNEITSTFESNGIWKDTMGFLTRVDRPCTKELKVEEDDGSPLGDGIKRPLIGKVTIRVRILLQGTVKPLAVFNVPITIQKGRLTEKGFIPD